MANEIVAAVQSARLLMDVVKANEILANFHELVAAVSEVNAKLLSAQTAALLSQEKQEALIERIHQLEKEVAELKGEGTAKAESRPAQSGHTHP
jgi:hypothetical protein